MKRIEKKIINETIEGKIDDLMDKVKGKMDEVGLEKPKRPMVKQEKNPKLRKVEKPKRPKVKQEKNPDYVKPEKTKRPMVKQEKNPNLDETMDNMKEGDVTEGNEFSEARCKALCAGEKSFKVGGDVYPLKNISDKDRKDCNCGSSVDESKLRESVKDIVSEIKIRKYDGKKKSKKSVVMSESELVSFVKELLEEEAKANGMKEVDRVKKTTNTETQKYLNDLAKKLKDYASVDVKKKETKDFPDRNKSDEEIKAHRNSDEDDEFIEDFSQIGMESMIDPDDYDKNRNKDYIEGSSETGNSPDYANAVETDVNKNIGKKIKRGALKKEKERSYNKDPQPVTNVKESLKEEFDRIKEIAFYNEKTQ